MSKIDIVKIEKIKKFLQDEILVQSVKEVLIKSFLKTRGSYDVQFLAASRIAIDLLEDGFKELNKISKVEKNEEKEIKQVGL